MPEYHYLTPVLFAVPLGEVRRRPVTSGRRSCPPRAAVAAALRLAVVAVLLLFRLTCYYYRGAYYRSVWQSRPPAPWPSHTRNTLAKPRLPLIIQNTPPVLLLYRRHHLGDQHLRRHRRLPLGQDGGFGFGLGNIILVANVVLLWIYTLSCHSCRHIAGGRLKHFSKHRSGSTGPGPRSARSTLATRCSRGSPSAA